MSSDLVPALPPPPGKVSNFVNPTNCAAKFIAVNAVFLPIALIALGIRIWTRAFIARGFRWDDALMIVSFVMSIILSAVTLDMLNWGLAVHMWDVPASHLSPMFMKLNLVAAIIYCAGTGFLKVSVLLFYTRIFPSRNFHIAIWILVFIAAGYNIASVLANVFSCNPIAKSWDLSITHGTCMNRPVFYFANAGLGIFTDFATVLVPVPWLRRLQMPLRQKIAVGGILAMGCFVGVVSCVRLSSLYTLQNSTDLTWTTTNALMWCVIELNLGITGGCVTVMRPFVRRYFPRLLGLSTNSSGNGYPSRSKSHSHQLHSFPRDDQPDFSGHRHKYSTALKSGADNSSEEFILNGTPPAKELDGIIRIVEFDIKKTVGPS
ncbi:integral membrane protein [Aspergillus keveii]|uniref:Integral membrane protein n=1 Tax=Aspergillus keveii TaxID=714993 RepID=A0ABR4G4R3_9EURO